MKVLYPTEDFVMKYNEFTSSIQRDVKSLVSHTIYLMRN